MIYAPRGHKPSARPEGISNRVGLADSHVVFIKRSGHWWAVDENPGRTLWERQSPFVATWVARAVQLTGLVDVVSGVLPGSRPRLGLVIEVV